MTCSGGNHGFEDQTLACLRRCLCRNPDCGVCPEATTTCGNRHRHRLARHFRHRQFAHAADRRHARSSCWPPPPATFPDGLNKLPIFQISGSSRTLSRRRPQQCQRQLPEPAQFRRSSAPWCCWMASACRRRTRTARSTSSTLPQMLMSRVDVVTGGASAVYGSDAVAGVVNFVLDKKFTASNTISMPASRDMATGPTQADLAGHRPVGRQGPFRSLGGIASPRPVKQSTDPMVLRPFLRRQAKRAPARLPTPLTGSKMPAVPTPPSADLSRGVCQPVR